MTGTALALVVAASILHAIWNALTKRGREGFPAAAVPFVIATIVLHALYFYALGRSYGSGEFSLVYPIARGLGVALVDKAGVARLHPVPYLAVMGLGSVVLLIPSVVGRRRALRREWAVNWRTILIAYLLVLFAFRLSKVGYVVAARELSIVFSAFIGSLWLGEGRLGPRLAGAAIVLAGVVGVAFAR